MALPTTTVAAFYTERMSDFVQAFYWHTAMDLYRSTHTAV